MENNNKRESIKRKVLIFSLILFFVIFIVGSIVFTLAYSQITRTNTGHELVNEIEIEKIKLESSVNGEIALAMKMATSPLIIQHFLNPNDPTVRRIAFDEIESYRMAFASKQVFWASDIDKEFYFAEDNHYTIDADNPDNYWYKMTLYETVKYNFNINYNAQSKSIMLWINATVFDPSVRSNLGRGAGLPIGLVGTGIDLTSFINSIYKGYDGKANLYFFNTDGEITGASNSALVTDKVKINKHLADIGQKILDSASLVKTDGYQRFEISSGVVAVGEVPALNWYITAIQPVTLADILGSNMTIVFLAMIAVIAGIFVVFYVYIGMMITPLNEMVKALDHISVDWDLTKLLHLHSHLKDEIGTLGNYFNQTFERMKILLLGIKGKTITMTTTGDELATYATKSRKDIEEINVDIKKMRDEILTQSDNVNSTVSSVERIINDIDELNVNITRQAESVAQSSSAIEEMLANIQSVTQTLVKNTANINSLAETSGAGRADLYKVSTDIQEIAKESEGLLQINSVMQTIASQTNLLSMNAAIEAAHAGESGKGFAVVADEIRKLAENSGKQSKTISTVLKKIKEMIDTITRSTSIVIERFKAIEDEIKTVSEQESQIRTAMEEQGEGSRQILDAVTNLNTVTGQVRKSSSDMIKESKDVLKQSVSLKKVTAEIAGDMDDMTRSTEEITDVFKRIDEITDENKDNITELSIDISKFKVD